jgi:hypothetical protein
MIGTSLEGSIRRLVERRYARPDGFRHELAVCAIFKDEALYLEEWLRFHRGVGVDHFYLYDNDSTDDYLEVLEPWLRRRIVSLIHWPGKMQKEAYNHCLARAKAEARWLAFIDIDEFLFSPERQSLARTLRDYDDVPAVFVYWVLFGSSGHLKRPAGPVIEAYQRCLDKESAQRDEFGREKDRTKTHYVTAWADYGKCIVQPRFVRLMGVHKPKKLWIGRVLDENRQVARPLDPRGKISYSVLRINHYWAKSQEDMAEKVRKGNIDNRNEPPRKLETWLKRERQLNVAQDRTILEIWEKVKSNSDPMAKA